MKTNSIFSFVIILAISAGALAADPTATPATSPAASQPTSNIELHRDKFPKSKVSFSEIVTMKQETPKIGTITKEIKVSKQQLVNMRTCDLIATQSYVATLAFEGDNTLNVRASSSDGDQPPVKGTWSIDKSGKVQIIVAGNKRNVFFNKQSFDEHYCYWNSADIKN